MFVKEEESHPVRRYVINESGKRWLASEKPYRDGEGNWFDTMFDVIDAEKSRAD